MSRNGKSPEESLAKTLHNAVSGLVAQVRTTWVDVMTGVRSRLANDSNSNGAQDKREHEMRRQALLEMAPVEPPRAKPAAPQPRPVLLGRRCRGVWAAASTDFPPFEDP
ncbi:MAG: hypothetical protein HY319_21670 [Armatimonadetes bacterium]|nr:hypothetical protein [Armatimonadota bacterium]